MFEKIMYLATQAQPGLEIPFIWFWPEGRTSCAVMTHDVESASGLEFISHLMDMNDSFFHQKFLSAYSGCTICSDPRNIGFSPRKRFRGQCPRFKSMTVTSMTAMTNSSRSAQKINTFVDQFGSRVFAQEPCTGIKPGIANSNSLMTCQCQMSLIWIHSAGAVVPSCHISWTIFSRFR